MFNVRPGDSLGILTVVSDYYCNSGIVSSHAVDEILKLIITQESLCSYGNQSADIVLCREGGSDSGYAHTCVSQTVIIPTCRCTALPPLDPVLYSLGVTP